MSQRGPKGSKWIQMANPTYFFYHFGPYWVHLYSFDHSGKKSIFAKKTPCFAAKYQVLSEMAFKKQKIGYQIKHINGHDNQRE